MQYWSHFHPLKHLSIPVLPAFFLCYLLSLTMNRVWVPHPVEFVKINIFVATPVEPLANGNSNGVGIIMRNHNGFLVWGVMCPVKDLTEYQTQLWAIHKGMKEAYSRGFFNTLIETEHVESSVSSGGKTLRKLLERALWTPLGQ